MTATIHAHPMAATLDRAHQAAQQRRFLIDIARPDGSPEHLERIGGHSMDHAAEGMERAGIGGVVRVVPVREVAYGPA